MILERRHIDIQEVLLGDREEAGGTLTFAQIVVLGVLPFQLVTVIVMHCRPPLLAPSYGFSTSY
jgi:hypothetical protein